MDFDEAGIQERIFNFKQQFLKFRSFKVKVNETLPDTKIKTEGMPQGTVVSPTFFILKINRTVAQLPNDDKFQISLYMDDLQISYCHPKMKVGERKLQDSINIVEKFGQKNGFKF